MQDIFKKIIDSRAWQHTRCGTGSTLLNTEMLREQLPAFLLKHNIKSMLDAPCGDHSWMQYVEFDKDFKYVGADVVEFLIKHNKETYPNKEFVQLDLTVSDLPDVDLLFCRDCLIHFSQQDVKRALKNIARSSIKYVMFTNHPTVDRERDIPTGHYRPINFMLEPFCFDEPVDIIEDRYREYLNKEVAPRNMSLWTIEQIRKYAEYDY